MNHTGNRSQYDSRTIVIFGAGRIGRSFIGQLFGLGGYKVVFVDIDKTLVDRLNNRRGYTIIVKADKDEEIYVPNVRAIHLSRSEEVTYEISKAGIMAISVGKNAIENTIPCIAEGLRHRFNSDPEKPLDIIIAENMRDANEFMREGLIKKLPPGFPFSRFVGLVETSIGKMVPIMTNADLEKDPLVIFAEPYNTLIVDAKAFRSPIPEIKGLVPMDNIKAWVDRKAFIHNLGHASAAYYGYRVCPGAKYIYEVLEESSVIQFTRDVMLQSADILTTVYSSEFSLADLEEHIDDLIHRFMNKALCDTIYRVGHDLTRKLASGDRFMGAVKLAKNNWRPYDLILRAMSYGLSFKAKDNEGNCFKEDIDFLTAIETDFKSAIGEYLQIDTDSDLDIIESLKTLYLMNTKHNEV